MAGNKDFPYQQPGSAVQGEAGAFYVCPVCKGPGVVTKETHDAYMAQPSAPAAEQGESIARKFDRDVLEPLRKKDRATQPEARGVEGMVLVPREPTQSMLSALGRAANASCNRSEWYAHLLSAAPSRPVVDDGTRMTPYTAKLWLDELMGDHDFTLPTGAYNELLDALGQQERS